MLMRTCDMAALFNGFDSSTNGLTQVGNLLATHSESYLYPSGRQWKDWTPERLEKFPLAPSP